MTGSVRADPKTDVDTEGEGGSGDRPKRPDSAMSGRVDKAAAPAVRQPSAPLDGRALVLWELVQTSHLAVKLFRETFAAFGLTPTQFGVLLHLAEGTDLTKAQLARAVLVSPQSMDPLIETLLSAGYVERDGPARRGRAAAIRITADGLAQLAVVRPAIDALNRPERLHLEPDDIEPLVQQLRSIRNALQQQQQQTL